MFLIWLQSSHFNPDLVSSSSLSMNVDLRILLFLGIVFELLHLIEFGILFFLLIVAFLAFGKLTPGKEYWAIIISVIYSLVDEVHQYFVPFRSFSLGDIFKDFVGILLIWLLVRHVYYKKNKSRLGLVLKNITPL
jgi:polysaccharide biosynthesis protein VpsQ